MSQLDPATWTVVLNVVAVVLNTLGAALGAYLRATNGRRNGS
jgi:hypothetical protein